MAIPRLFNSYSPFLVVERGSGRTFLEKQDGPAGEEGEAHNEEEGSLLAQAIRPKLSRALERGTAQYMTSEWPGALQKNPYVSIVAQAEGEGWQEFSPSSTEPMFPRSLVLSEQRPATVRKHAPLSESDGEACPPAHQRHPCRKPRRKPWRRRSLVENHQEPPIIQGLWVQEIDWLRPRPGHGTATPAADPTWTPSLPCGIIPPPPQFTDRVAAAADHRCHGDDAAKSGDDGYRATVQVKHLTLSEEEDAEHTGGQNHSVDPDSALGPRGGGGGGGGGGSESACAPTASGESASWASWSSDEPEAEFTSSSWSRGSDSSGGGSVPDCSDRSENPGGSANAGCTCASVAVGSQCTCAAEVGGGVGEGLLAELRGKVTRAESRFIWPFFKEREKQQPMHEGTDADEQANEGILLHDLLQPAGWMYREGLEYDSLRHIQNGSYGDVVCIQDRRTGFQCAAKRVAQRHFSSEELSTWSALDSPHVVRLLGAVSEGPNVVLFMDLKPGCLAQVLKERVKLPEDLALHYLRQVLWALEHLHRRRILHLDIKDNVLLSADGRNTFLCDFGLSERCDLNGKSTRTYRGPAFPGTETHMAPEVAGGDQRCCKADVWSSCCMLLHMLNGCPPWVRYYAPPLCLKISSEPPPLWEVPSRCNHFTARLLRAGLRKDPGRRASARELRRKTTKALRAVGGLNPSSLPGAGPLPTEAPPPQAPMCWISPWRVAAIQQDSSEYEEAVSGLDSDEDQEEDRDPHPRSLRVLGWGSDCDPEVDIYMGEEEFWERRGVLTQRDRNYEGDWEEEEEEEEEWESSSSPGMFCALREHFPLLRSGVQRTRASWGSEPELTHLREDVAPDNPVVNLSPEPRDYPPSCLSCTDSSQISDQDSDRWSDDLSSGVFSSYNSQNDGHMEWMLSANQPSSHCFEGVDIWIEDVHGACLRIRERRRVNVGHVAIGISDQISVKAFTLETLDRKLVSFQQEVQESGLWLRCVPAPDRCPRWYWRINDGKLDLRGAL